MGFGEVGGPPLKSSPPGLGWDPRAFGCRGGLISCRTISTRQDILFPKTFRTFVAPSIGSCKPSEVFGLICLYGSVQQWLCATFFNFSTSHIIQTLTL